MKRVLSLVLSLVMVLGILTGMDVSVFASASTTQISISDTKKEVVVGSSLAVSASYSSDTYSHNSDTISIDISGKADGLTVDGDVSCLGTKEDGIISYSLIANQVGKYTVTIIGPDSSCDSLDVYVTESNGYFTVAGKLEEYVTSVVLDESGENWVSEIIVDGITYPVQKHLIDSDRAENAKGKDVVFTVYDGEVDSFYIIDDLSTTATVGLSPLNLIYENGRFPDKKIDISGYINASSLLNFQINQEILSNYSNLKLTDINITLTSQNTDIIYFKSGMFGGKNNSVSFSLDGNLAIGESKLFSQEARVNTGYSFPENLEEDTVIITCSFNATCGDVPVSDTTELIVKLTNNDYNYKSTWQKQSLTSLMEQMQSSVQTCPSNILTSAEKAEVTSTISAIIINEQMSKLSDDLDAFESIYDLSCYFYGLNTATMATAGEYFLDAIISECNTASDDLKRELNNLLESLTESKAFNKFVHWYYNNQQLQLGNKKQVNAHCPIDVSVTDEDGIQVLSIVNDEVVTSLEGATGFVCDSQKTLYLPTDIDHKIKITATADGIMDYSVIEYSSAGTDRVVSYSDIALTNEEIYTGSITRIELPSKESYKLTSSGDLTFVLNSDRNSYSVSDCNEFASGWLVIPSTYKGLPVTSIENNSFEGCTNLTSIIIPDSVTSISYCAFERCISLTSITIPDSVMVIGNWAFADCTSLISITIPDSVTSIGEGVFIGCKALVSVIIPEGVTNIYKESFYDCTSLVSITIPDGVTSIGDSAFNNCTSLISITIPNTVTYIGDSAFQNCDSFISITIPDSVKRIDKEVFRSCSSLVSATIGAGVTSIDDRIFFYCTSLAKIAIPDGVTYIGEGAFEGCESLTSITIPDSVTSIDWDAFNGCTGLTSIIIGVGLTSISCRAFYGCTNLTSVYIEDIISWCNINFAESHSNPLYYANQLYINKKLATDVIIPDGVTMIPIYGFWCENIKTITIPDSVTSIAECAFRGCTDLTNINVDINNSNYSSVDGVLFSKDKTILIQYPRGKTDTKYTIGNNITSIGDYAFSGCTYLTSIIIPDSVTSIGSEAFYGCTKLSSITIPDSVIHIDSFAFKCCKGLKSVVIGKNLTIISSSVFDECTNLISITIPSSVTGINNDAFRNCDELKFVFYSGSKSDWEKILIAYGNASIRYSAIHYNSTDHNYGDLLTKFPCVESGMKYYECSVCGYIDEIEELPALGVHISSDWIVDTEATCIENGLKRKECIVCGQVLETETLLSLGHTPSDWIVDTEATCTTTGSRHKECTVCGQVLETETLLSLGHTPSDWIVDTEATCTTTSSRHKECTVCSQVLVTETSFVFGHTSSDWIVDTESTCNKIGSKHKECIVCGLVLEAESIPALGHNYSTEWTIDATATCTEEGSKSHHCLNCDSITDVTVIAAIGHSASDWIIDENATCIATGSKHKECSVCGEVVGIEQIISQGHNWENDICTICGLSKLDLIESEHPYGSNADESWTIYREGAGSISVMFSEDTKTELGYDFIYIYDGDNNQVGKYSGTQLAGQTITVNDDTIIIRLTSDSGFEYYGFEVVNIQYETKCNHKWEKDSTNCVAATCTQSGVKAEICSICGETRKTEISAIGHKSSSWITDKKATVNAAGKKHKECTECGEVLETAKIAQLKCSKPKLSKIENTSSGVKITWGKVSGADKYYIYRKTGSSGKYSKIATTTKTYYTDKKASSGKKYYYYVKAVNEAGSSSASSSKSIYYLADPTLKTPKSTKKGVKLEWSKVKGADGYVIYYKTGSGSYKKLTTVKGSSKVTYTHTKAKKGKTYTYKVKAYKSKTYSAYSNAKKIKDKY